MFVSAPKAIRVSTPSSFNNKSRSVWKKPLYLRFGTIKSFSVTLKTANGFAASVPFIPCSPHNSNSLSNPLI